MSKDVIPPAAVAENLRFFVGLDARLFPAVIERSKTVGELKEVILKKVPTTLKGVKAHQLTLYKVDINLNEHGKDYLRRLDVTDGEELLEWKPVSTYWPKQPEAERLHVLVKPPYTIPQSARPSINTRWCPRFSLVRRLYDMLETFQLVQVRGTPGSGKTTLKALLNNYIHEQDSRALVKYIHSWARHPEEDLGTALTRIDPEFPTPPDPTFLLFDEAQDTYGDFDLWNTFFKRVHGHDYKNYYVVLFCSYGSPSSRLVTYKRGTSLTLGSSARISLRESEESGGLLLSRTEFEDVITKYDRSLNLHPDLVNHIFHLTAGHVGAVITLLDIVLNKERAETRKRVQFTLDEFNKENPIHSLVQAIKSGPFACGLPTSDQLANKVGVSTFLRTLIKDGEVRRAGTDADIEYCHRNGWVYSYKEEYATCYTFPSPLHSVFVSWILEPSNDMPQYSSVFSLCREAIKMFKPSQMHTPIRRVGQQGAVISLPEAQYQDEFYRSVFCATAGNVCISPEFASPERSYMKGRIDFFIPIMKWGIRITRDGNRLSEHNARFKETGAYGAWLQSGDVTDYVLLDCRASVPQKRHGNIPNLFHVVFSNEFQLVTLYNNQLEEVDMFTLVENHT